MSGSEGGYLVPDGLVKFILEGSWVDHFSPLPGWEMKLVRTFAAKLVGLRHSKARMFGKKYDDSGEYDFTIKVLK
ncbi:MAG: hypothetical protein UT69_C0018G0012 [Candidatus Yanofskybacteria bacterium GW2011_GWE1_40_10]|nr:MAG: hypothetical protein UT69_C0018G0012 [Candidatus Yanofskybacteria bacterium GW2011_GWE1_40_10]